MWYWTWGVLPWKWETRFIFLLCTLLSTSGNGDRFLSFVQKLLWKQPCLFPTALKDCIVRPHCNQMTQEGDFFSFPFLKLGFYLCASTTEIETLAKRSLLNGVPRCLALQPICWTHSTRAGIGHWEGRGTFADSKNFSKMLVSRDGWFWRGSLGHTRYIPCFPHMWIKGTDFPGGLLTNALNWLWHLSKLLVSCLGPS